MLPFAIKLYIILRISLLECNLHRDRNMINSLKPNVQK